MSVTDTGHEVFSSWGNVALLVQLQLATFAAAQVTAGPEGFVGQTSCRLLIDGKCSVPS